MEQNINEKPTTKLKPQANIWQKRFYWSTGILSALLILALACGAGYAISINNNIVSDDDLAALAVFDEIARPFINNFNADGENHPTVTEVYDHGISPDGDFNIGFNLCERVPDKKVETANKGTDADSVESETNDAESPTGNTSTEQSEPSYHYGNCKNGRIYFWWDDEHGRSYGFGYDE